MEDAAAKVTVVSKSLSLIVAPSWLGKLEYADEMFSETFNSDLCIALTRSNRNKRARVGVEVA